MKREMKRGQVTIFVIIAVLLVGAIVVLYLLFPNFLNVIIPIETSLSPNNFLVDCVDKEIDSSIELLSARGGYANPEGSVLYKDNEVKYLCYTSQYYVPCVVQQPMIKQHFEQELAQILESKSKECINKLKEEYEKKGYIVTLQEEAKANVEIYPGKVFLNVNSPMSIKKDTTETYKDFNFVRDSSMYSLLMLATSIIDFESTYGDSETTAYMNIYPEIRVRKDIKTDGTKIYVLEDVTTKETFTFASRSLAWPGGYGV